MIKKLKKPIKSLTGLSNETALEHFRCEIWSLHYKVMEIIEVLNGLLEKDNTLEDVFTQSLRKARRDKADYRISINDPNPERDL